MTGETELDGQSRRRLRTRAALMEAGRELLGCGREDASIEEITQTASVGFGSFSNHFPDGKAAFFQEVARQMLADLGAQLVRVTEPCTDPLVALATDFRTLTMSAWHSPSTSIVLTRPGRSTRMLTDTLRQVALTEVEKAMASGDFLPGVPAVHLAILGSVLLGALEVVRRDEADVDPAATEEMVDAMTAAALRALGASEQRIAEALRQSRQFDGCGVGD